MQPRALAKPSTTNFFVVTAEHSGLIIMRAGKSAYSSAWVQAINPILILLFTPLLTTIWKIQCEPHTLVKMAMGNIFVGASFLFLAAAARRAVAP